MKSRRLRQPSLFAATGMGDSSETPFLRRAPLLMNRATGLLVIEVVNSNPNGNPDQESDPRLRSDERGMISPVSFKRKLRDLIEDKEGPVWEHLAAGFNPAALQPDEYQILESRGRDRNEIKALDTAEFVRRYWDARLFG